MKVTFLGGVGTVTGSKFLLTTDKKDKILIDCGLFQGIKELRLKNWRELEVNASELTAVVLTHAHLDHSGYIPKLIAEGFTGKIYATPATRDLCQILLSDSGYLQEEEARFRNKHKSTKHKPALPLYTQEQAEKSLEYFVTKELNEEFIVGEQKFKFFESGHILGAASVLINTNKGKKLVFSGDLGRFDDPVMNPPKHCPSAHYIFMESTYGGKLHPKEDIVEYLAQLIKKMKKDSGVLMIPSFAVGRAQSIMYLLYKVFEKHPDLEIPVYLNSPMATNVTHLFRQYTSEHKLNEAECEEVCQVAHFVKSVEESKDLNTKTGPMIIISASGMLTGGRILHHLIAFANDPKNAILLVGYQAPGTRGYSLLSGNDELKIHGSYRKIRAQIYQTEALSAHADQNDLLKWLEKTENVQRLCLVHGEPAESDALRLRVKDRYGYKCLMPSIGESIEIN